MSTLSPIFQTDSCKFSHYKQYPPGTAYISSYIEPRGGGDVTFFGLQAFLKKLPRVTYDDIALAHNIATQHGVPFNSGGWTRIVEKWGGYLPLEIQAVPEGMTMPHGMPQVQVRNTDPLLPWLTSYFETALLRAVWYPSTVASISRRAKIVIGDYLAKTGDLSGLPFKLHDFGARGVSSGESAALGGLAHLVNFSGTDTVEALLLARDAYTCPMAGYSIPAAEHSTITSWGAKGEVAAYRNMLTAFDGFPLVAVVSDSYDIFKAVGEIWGGTLKEDVVALGEKGRTLVIRPDSGDPLSTLLSIFSILEEKFPVTVNEKGYKVLPAYLRVIQGDGVNLKSIGDILQVLTERGWSADNIAFGMGGALLQKLDRDTFKYAMKANERQSVDGTIHPVFKSPVGDGGKASKAYRQAVVKQGGVYYSIPESKLGPNENLLKPVWKNGELLVDWSLEEVRENAATSATEE